MSTKDKEVDPVEVAEAKVEAQQKNPSDVIAEAVQKQATTQAAHAKKAAKG